MNIVFTNHSKYRIEERGISIEDIKISIKNPDKQKIQSYDTIVVIKVFKKSTLNVVYKSVKNKIIIITAYYEY